MSKNCIDETINISQACKFPIFLIASRRQIETMELGNGYVENFSTEEYSKYVNLKKPKNIYLCRDHGGPYQGAIELSKKISLKKAIENAKISYKADIINNFKVIHIDTSVYSHNKNNKWNNNKSLEILFELYEYCYSISRKHKKDIVFEIGTEEQSGLSADFEQVEYNLSKINEFTSKQRIPAHCSMLYKLVLR